MTSLVALALGALVTAPSAAPAAVPSLAGTWTLNKEESEDARAKMRDSGGERPGGWTGPGGRGGMGGPGGGVGGRSGGFGGRGGGFGGRGADPDGGRDSGRDSGSRRAFLQPPETLAITQTAEEIGIDDGDRVLHLHPDGRKIKSEGGGAETTARWRGNELVVETKADRGAKITSAYMLVPEKHQLYITSTMEGRSGEPITVRRVYDAAPAESGQ
jgi:hypothetical protein